MTFTPRELPDLTARTIVITGAGRGVGYFTAERLAEAGARVVLGVRSDERWDAASRSILERVPSARLERATIDLSSLDSIERAAAHIATLGVVDVLINNAGLTSGTRTRRQTVDGLELMVGTNHVGAFALTARLWPTLAPDARIVGLGSLSTKLARARLDDMMGERSFSLSRAYATSKHAVHAFALELDRRLRASGSARRSLLAHPGFALDGLASPRPGVTDLQSPRQRAIERSLGLFAQGKDGGAWPVVWASTDPLAEGGQLWGPRRLVKGEPTLQRPVAQSADPAFGAEVWRLSEGWAGLTFDPTGGRA